MSEDQAKYTVKFGEGERMKELVIRHGEAQVIELPEKIAVIGNIDAPGRFVKTRDPLHDEKKCHVYVSRANGTITFIEDETNPQRKVITGKLVQSPELEAFRINTGNKSGLKDLTNFLRMRRRYFHDKEEHTTLIDRLSNFVAKVNTKIQTKDDRKGHTLIMIEKKVSHEIPPAFKLDMRLVREDAVGRGRIFYFRESGLRV